MDIITIKLVSTENYHTEFQPFDNKKQIINKIVKLQNI